MIMPKKSLESATYYGHEGHVVDANDQVHQVDPSRNLDGSVVEGFESDEREIEEREGSEQPGHPLRGLPDDLSTVEFVNTDATGDAAKALPHGQGPDGEPIVGSTANTPEENANLSERAARRETLTAETDTSTVPEPEQETPEQTADRADTKPRRSRRTAEK